MKSHLLLFLSAVLLLFTLPKSGNLYGISGVEQSQQVKKNCAAGALKRPCTRKCLKHQTHSGQRGAGTVLTDCSQPFYALAPAPQQQPSFVAEPAQQEARLPSGKPHSPFLQIEPDPPRLL
ncbi:hypothetical protein [Pontibacter kalidii]|uniref:hypothetical protein n=1 Tax=Pontibacter kalidii TaxID=2592049 RepID=UPI002258A954|nr:hypothetical protein [Pontibacter kalidii]